MLRFDFERLITELCDYYERKEPKLGTVDLWFEKVKSIPSEAMPWIIKKICHENERFPNNLPGMLAALFFSWRESNPDKVASQARFYCPDCEDGTIQTWKIGANGRCYSYLFRCARCRQDNTQAWPLAHRDELLRQGYEPEQIERRAIAHGSVSEVIAEVVENSEIPF